RGLPFMKHWRLADQRRVRPDRRRWARPPHLALPFLQPAGHGIELELVESWSRAGLADQLEVPLGQAEAPHQRHQPAGEAEKSGGGAGAIWVEVAEQARQ